MFRACSLELISTTFQPWNIVFLSQQISINTRRKISQSRVLLGTDLFLFSQTLLVTDLS